jgi:predicted CoA-binding protein
MDMADVTPHHPGDEDLRRILEESKTIAVVGLSSKPDRASNEVAAYLKEHGYRIIPVNPKEEQVLGERSYDSLGEIPEPVDVVDVFRRAEDTPPVAKEAAQIGAKVLWLQEDIVSDEARKIAEEGGLDVVMGICIKKTRQRLVG